MPGIQGPQGNTGNTGPTGGIGPTGPAGTAFSTDSVRLAPELGQPLSSGSFPTYSLKPGTNVPLSVLSFTKGQSIFFKFYPSTYGASNPNITVLIEWESATGQTSGAVVWGAAMVAVAPASATNLETMSLATQATVTQTVNGNAQGLNEATISISGSSLNSVTAGDMVWIQLQRVNTGADTMTGGADMHFAIVSWPTT